MSECKRLYDKAISLSPDFADAMGGYGESRPLPRFSLSRLLDFWVDRRSTWHKVSS
jgi:hypothetical protein